MRRVDKMLDRALEKAKIRARVEKDLMAIVILDDDSDKGDEVLVDVLFVEVRDDDPWSFPLERSHVVIGRAEDPQDDEVDDLVEAALTWAARNNILMRVRI